MGNKLVGLLTIGLVTVFGVTAFALVALPQTSQALSGSEFKAGNIISDSVFFSGPTMNLGDVQRFLDAKVPTCDTYGAQPSGRAGYPTRADWGRANGVQPPYTCLKNYRQDTQNKSAEAGLCKGYTATGNQSAAEIIYYVAESCGINPKALIVLLQKEQSLITDDWPWPVQYRSATGYGCPDTAPCDAEYYGFFNQVYSAARQFKRYAQGGYNHKANMNNYVRYNPNAACGGSTVYIENQATAGLYNYTPYQPNQAALNNLYGTGDGCSAYGNRNFWRLFNDWFGSTLGGSYLLRTVDNASVYLVVGNTKYPIGDSNIMNALSPLGPVGYVSSQYLDSKTTGQLLKRLIRGEDGTVYFFDSGIKLPFTSCATIEHYGYTCGDAITLGDGQLAALATGPTATRLYGTTSGKLFYIDNATKREVYDMKTLQDLSMSTAYNLLAEAGLNHLAYGDPLIRNNVIVGQRGGSYKGLYLQGTLNTLSGGMYEQSALSSKLPTVNMDLQSLNQVTKENFNGYISNLASNKFYIITKIGKAELTDHTRWISSYKAVSDTLLGLLPSDSSSQINSGLVKSPSDGTVYYVVNKQKRPIGSWGDLLKVNSQPQITTIADHYVNSLSTGVRLLGPGSLVKYANSDATVYLIDGLSKKIPLTAFSISTNMGVGNGVASVNASVLDSYNTANFYLSSNVTCGAKNYAGSNGKMYEVTPGLQSHYQFSYITLDALTCNNLPISQSPLTRFIRTPDTTIYYVDNGSKKAFTSYQAYLNHGGNNTNTINVSEYFASKLATGTPINN